LKPRKGIDFVIAAEIRDYLMASIPQHVALLLDDDILTSCMLIPVVYDKDLHLWRDSLPGCCGRSGLLTLSPAGEQRNARSCDQEKLTAGLRNMQSSA
jgi:hypothetical protein